MAIFRLKKLTIINYFYFPWHQDIDDIQYLNLIEIQFQIGRKLKLLITIIVFIVLILFFKCYKLHSYSHISDIHSRT